MVRAQFPFPLPKDKDKKENPDQKPGDRLDSLLSMLGKHNKYKTRSYDNVITADAVAYKGLFSIYEVRDSFFFEIPDTLLGHDMQMIHRLVKGTIVRDAMNKDYAYPEGVNNQISEWSKVGYLRGAPPLQAIPRVARWDDPDLAGKGSTTEGTGYTKEPRGSLETRARAYLDNNCGHCHQPGGTAGYTGIDLRVTNVGMQSLGVCKSPNAAGRVGTLVYDLVPGKPDESILLARMESTRPKEMMPQIGRSVVHAEGVALVREWIKSLPQDGAACFAKTTSRP